MEFFDLSLKGLKLIVPKVHRDPRGYFLETFREEDFAKAGIDVHFVQENHSLSKKNTIRGMHFQTDPGQAKLVRVVYGYIYDVVVDIRPDSSTFKCWQGIYLDGEEHRLLYIPEGFAHGFCVLSEEAHVVYKVDTYYDPKAEKRFRYDDPEIGISWPVTHPILSEKDITCLSFRKTFSLV